MVTFFCLMALILMGSFVALLYISMMGNEPKTVNPNIITIKTTLKHPWGRKMIAGGQARLALWCHLNGIIEIPTSYTPRDIDYVSIVKRYGHKKGVLYNTGATSSGIDELIISSIQDYFERVDLLTNQVLLEGNIIYTTQEAINCFKQGLVKINPWHLIMVLEDRKDHHDYLLLRACIQAGYDIHKRCYHYRHGACKLPESTIRSLDKEALKGHRYITTYNKKLLQIKGGCH